MPKEKADDIRITTLSSIILGLYLSVPSEEYESLTNAIGEMSGTIVNTMLLESHLMKGDHVSVAEALTATIGALRDLLGSATAKLKFIKAREGELVLRDCPICESSRTLSISPEKPICNILGILIKKVTVAYLQRLGVESNLEVVETECKAKGAPACKFRMTWREEKKVHTTYVEWEEKRAEEESRAHLDLIAIRSSIRAL
jgi:predicted hydrocarbon binding protein